MERRTIPPGSISKSDYAQRVFSRFSSSRARRRLYEVIKQDPELLHRLTLAGFSSRTKFFTPQELLILAAFHVE